MDKDYRTKPDLASLKRQRKNSFLRWRLRLVRFCPVVLSSTCAQLFRHQPDLVRQLKAALRAGRAAWHGAETSAHRCLYTGCCATPKGTQGFPKLPRTLPRRQADATRLKKLGKSRAKVLPLGLIGIFGAGR